MNIRRLCWKQRRWYMTAELSREKLDMDVMTARFRSRKARRQRRNYYLRLVLPKRIENVSVI